MGKVAQGNFCSERVNSQRQRFCFPVYVSAWEGFCVQNPVRIKAFGSQFILVPAP